MSGHKVGTLGLLITTLGLLITMTTLLLASVRKTFAHVEGESCMSYHPNVKSWVFSVCCVGCRISNLSLQTALFCTPFNWPKNGPLAKCVEGVCHNSSLYKNKPVLLMIHDAPRILQFVGMRVIIVHTLWKERVRCRGLA